MTVGLLQLHCLIPEWPSSQIAVFCGIFLSSSMLQIAHCRISCTLAITAQYLERLPEYKFSRERPLSCDASHFGSRPTCRGVSLSHCCRHASRPTEANYSYRRIIVNSSAARVVEQLCTDVSSGNRPDRLCVGPCASRQFARFPFFTSTEQKWITVCTLTGRCVYSVEVATRI